MAYGMLLSSMASTALDFNVGMLSSEVGSDWHDWPARKKHANMLRLLRANRSLRKQREALQNKFLRRISVNLAKFVREDRQSVRSLDQIYKHFREQSLGCVFACSIPRGMVHKGSNVESCGTSNQQGQLCVTWKLGARLALRPAPGSFVSV